MPQHQKQNFDAGTKTKQFRPPHKNLVNSDPCTEIKTTSISHTDIKPIKTTHKKTKSVSTPTQNQVILRPVHKN